MTGASNPISAAELRRLGSTIIFSVERMMSAGYELSDAVQQISGVRRREKPSKN
jgi:hypothetical protein